MSDPPLASPSSIPLYLINGVATVWDAQGLRVGTLPGVSSQNGFLGLPITLMQEETAYLVRQGIAHLVPVKTQPMLDRPTATQREQYTTDRLNRIRLEEAALRVQEAERAKRAKEKFAQAGEAAQAKREARARARAEKAALAKQAEGELLPDTQSSQLPDLLGRKTSIDTDSPRSGLSGALGLVDGSVTASDDSGPIASNPEGRSTVVPIQGTHFHALPPLPAFPNFAFLPSITTVPDPLFPFPISPRDRALLATFTELQRREYRVGLGPRFGGEYLIYPGDYLRYHAHFTSQVLVNDEPIRPVEIVAWGRLGTGTKKAGLLCCWSDQEADAGQQGKNGQEQNDSGEKVTEVEFYSLEWANFG